MPKSSPLSLRIREILQDAENCEGAAKAAPSDSTVCYFNWAMVTFTFAATDAGSGA